MTIRHISLRRKEEILVSGCGRRREKAFEEICSVAEEEAGRRKKL